MVKVRQVIIVLLIVLLILASSFFIKINFTLSIYGKVYPAREFLVTIQDGIFSCKLIDYLSSFVTNEIKYSPERGDIAKFVIMRDLGKIERNVFAGDTIGYISSSYIIQKIKELKSELKYLKAEIEYYQSPQKKSLIELAKEKLNHAKINAEYRRKVYDRTRVLYKKKLISQEEFDKIKSDKDLAEINVRIAEKELESVSTGERHELINMLIKKVDKNRTMLNELEKQKKSLYILSPFSGRVMPSYSTDTVCTIRDNKNYIIIAPINLNKSFYIKKGMKVEAKMLGKRTQKISGEVLKLSDDVILLNRKQNRIVFIKVIGGNVELIKGMISRCKIYIGKQKIIERLIKVF